ncbi:MAG: translesion error-prone DNA polymerase V autoproteolytic subunit [Bacteroidota bacterium]
MQAIQAQRSSLSEEAFRSELDAARKIETGFPSPAADHIEKALNLEDLVVYRPSTTFYVRAEGDSMNASCIYDGDILIVDRSIYPQHGNIAIFALDGEPVIRRFVRQNDHILLVSDDAKLRPIPIFSETDWAIWGVITHVIHRYKL